MGSNEELQRDNAELRRSMTVLSGDLRLNTEAQQTTQIRVAELTVDIKTYRKTRCEEDHKELQALKTSCQNQRTDTAAAAGRAAGTRAGWIGAGLLLVQAAGMILAYLKLNPGG